MLRGGFHRIAHRGDESVEAHARILNVVDESVDALQHLIRGAPRFAIQTVNRQAGGGIGAGRDVRVLFAEDAVLGAENRDEFYAGRVRENVDGAPAGAVHAGFIRDQADALALKRREIFLLKNVNASERVVAAMVNPVETVRTLAVNAALDF